MRGFLSTGFHKYANVIGGRPGEARQGRHNVAQREQRWDNEFPLRKPRKGPHTYFPGVVAPAAGGLRSTGLA